MIDDDDDDDDDDDEEVTKIKHPDEDEESPPHDTSDPGEMKDSHELRLPLREEGRDMRILRERHRITKYRERGGDVDL